MNLVLNILLQSWNILLESSVFILFGLLVSGLLRVFLNPGAVSRHLGRGRFKSVLKASPIASSSSLSGWPTIALAPLETRR